MDNQYCALSRFEPDVMKLHTNALLRMVSAMLFQLKQHSSFMKVCYAAFFAPWVYNDTNGTIYCIWFSFHFNFISVSQKEMNPRSFLHRTIKNTIYMTCDNTPILCIAYVRACVREYLSTNKTKMDLMQIVYALFNSYLVCFVVIIIVVVVATNAAIVFIVKLLFALVLNVVNCTYFYTISTHCSLSFNFVMLFGFG